MQVSELVGDRDGAVSAWVPIRDVIEGRAALGRHAGAYLVAHFTGAPPVEVRLDQPGILYIGETHGYSQSLKSRVSAFARSVGLIDGTAFFHSAGERFAACCPGVEGEGLHVALAAFVGESRHPPDARGIFPQLFEKKLLAAFLDHWKALPVLNEDGRYASRDLDLSLDASALADYLRDGIPREGAAEAERWLGQVLHCAYEVRSIAWIDRYAPWVGLECHMGQGWYVYLGRAKGDAPLDFSVWAPQSRLFFEAPITTPEDARRAAWAFYAKWNYGVE